MIAIIISIVIFLLMFWRIAYINGLIGDWNNQLHIYIDSKTHSSPNSLVYYNKFFLNKWRYYFRLDVWTIKDIISDPFLIHDIHNQIQNKYK